MTPAAEGQDGRRRRNGRDGGREKPAAAGGQWDRRDSRGRQRNRPETRTRTSTAPSQRTRKADPARLAAFEVLRAVAEEDAYANLVLPGRIRHHHLDRRAAGFATELAYGALRGQGTYDAILSCCVDRPLTKLDPAIVDALRLGAHQLLAMRVPSHAALDQTVGLTRAVIGAGPGSLVNAVLRRVSALDLPGWLERLTADVNDSVRELSLRHSHPEWIVRALRQGLAIHGRDTSEIDALLQADNAAPVVNLVALPGLGSLAEAFEAGATEGELAPGSALFAAGDVGRLESVRAGTIRVQDAGSQLVARALAQAEADSGPGPEAWLDLCAGPGGKAALLAALAAQSGATVVANEPAKHRAALVRQALAAIPQGVWQVREQDGRSAGEELGGSFDRVLVDVPCTGLGALRRRPEARWRRQPSDVADLGPLQRDLLQSALDAAKPGGLVAYVTCSPHPAETTVVVADVLGKNQDAELLDAPAALEAASISGGINAGPGKTAQLWPHIHSTDAMFMALIRKNS